MKKEFWKSKIMWTQVLSLLTVACSSLLPQEYRGLAMAGIAFLTAILTFAFRWNTETPLTY